MNLKQILVITGPGTGLLLNRLQAIYLNQNANQAYKPDFIQALNCNWYLFTVGLYYSVIMMILDKSRATLLLKQVHGVDPSGTETGIFLEILSCAIATDALAPRTCKCQCY